MNWRVALVVVVIASLAVWLFQRRAQLSSVLTSSADVPPPPAPRAPVEVKSDAATVEGEGAQPPADTETSYIPNRAWERLQADLNGGTGVGHVLPPNAIYESDWPGNPSDDARFRAPTPEVWTATVDQEPWTASPETRQSAFGAEAPSSGDYRTL